MSQSSDEMLLGVRLASPNHRHTHHGGNGGDDGDIRARHDRDHDRGHDDGRDRGHDHDHAHIRHHVGAPRLCYRPCNRRSRRSVHKPVELWREARADIRWTRRRPEKDGI
jgi:hypothetical protein